MIAVLAATGSLVLAPPVSWALIGLLLVVVGAYAVRGILAGPDELADPAPVDHRACPGIDGEDCALITCRCTDVDRPCPGTAEPGCTHLGADCCDQHRSSCLDCRVDAFTETGGRWL